MNFNNFAYHDDDLRHWNKLFPVRLYDLDRFADFSSNSFTQTEQLNLLLKN